MGHSPPLPFVAAVFLRDLRVRMRGCQSCSPRLAVPAGADDDRRAMLRHTQQVPTYLPTYPGCNNDDLSQGLGVMWARYETLTIIAKQLYILYAQTYVRITNNTHVHTCLSHTSMHNLRCMLLHTELTLPCGSTATHSCQTSISTAATGVSSEERCLCRHAAASSCCCRPAAALRLR